MTESDKAVMQQALDALVIAEAGLADIGDAGREPGDDLAWCEARAAQALAYPRAAIIALREAIAQPEQPARQTWSWDKAQDTYLLDPPEVSTQPVQPTADKLLQIIAAAYQIAGACDVPFHILDVLANPKKSTQDQIDAMLPFVPMQPVLPSCTWHELNDADRQKAFESLPDMLDGFLKTWGWLHFAKAIEAKCRQKNIAQPVSKELK